MDYLQLFFVCVTVWDISYSLSLSVFTVWKSGIIFVQIICISVILFWIFFDFVILIDFYLARVFLPEFVYIHSICLHIFDLFANMFI